jgi:hypothetical protein
VTDFVRGEGWLQCTLQSRPGTAITFAFVFFKITFISLVVFTYLLLIYVLSPDLVNQQIF